MRIDKYIQQAADYEFDDLELQKLLDGKTDSTKAARVWSSIAEGSAPVEIALLWMQHVAREVIANVVDNDERDAAPAALRAIGFYGRLDAYRNARDYFATVASFNVIDEQSNPVVLGRQPASVWLKLLRSAGHLKDIDDKTAINKINTWRKELEIE